MPLSVRCLASSLLILLAFMNPGEAYLEGYGITQEEALGDLSRCCVNVVTHSVAKNLNGHVDYSEVIVVDTGVLLPVDEVEYILDDGWWIARIPRDRVVAAASKWTYTESKTNTYSPGTIIRRGNRDLICEYYVEEYEAYVISPGGERFTVERYEKIYDAKRSWNGRYGYSGRRLIYDSRKDDERFRPRAFRYRR